MRAVLSGPTGDFLVDVPGVTLGRARNNVLVLSDLAVSAHHAEVHVEGEICRLVDLGSLNGTFVNGQRLIAGELCILQVGDTLRLGETVLAFRQKNDDRVQPDEQDKGALLPTIFPVFTTSLAVPATLKQTVDERETFHSAHFTQPGVPSSSVPVVNLSTQPLIPVVKSLSPIPPDSPSSISPAPYPPVIPPSRVSTPPPRSQARLAVLLALILVLLLGSGSGFLFIQHNNDVAQQHALATASAWAALQATATAFVTSPYPPFTHLAFFDSLTGPENGYPGWDVEDNCQLTPQGYQIHATKEINYGTQICAAKNTDFGNFAFQVTMTITKGNCGGFLVRYREQVRADFLVLCRDGLVEAVLGIGL